MDKKTLKSLQSLKLKKYRYDHEKFLIEGKRLVQAAVEHEYPINEIYCTKAYLNKNRGWAVLDAIPIENINILPENDLKKISSTVSPSGVCAVCKIKPRELINFNQAKWVYLDKIKDPGNLGAILRSAAWFNLSNIAISPECVDVYNPKVIRSAMGSQFALEIHRDIELDTFQETHTIIASSLKGQKLEGFKFPDRFVLVFSNEAHGLSQSRKNSVNSFVNITKSGSGESLNVSNAASIIMYATSQFSLRGST